MSWLLGLTGSIGMGKSTTAQMFRDLGIPVWDADEAVHRLYSKGGAAVQPVSIVFPEALENGAISREKLKAALAQDSDGLRQLEQIVHPLVAEDRAAFISSNSADILVFDIPLLFETGADNWLDSVLVVSAPPETQRTRVLARAGMTEKQFEIILDRQMPDVEKRSRADHVIETDAMDDTRKAVRHLVEELRKNMADA